MQPTLNTASDMTPSTAMLFIIVAFVALFAVGILGDLQDKWREYTGGDDEPND